MARIMICILFLNLSVAGCGQEDVGLRSDIVGDNFALSGKSDSDPVTGVIFFVPGWGYDMSWLWRRSTQRYYQWLEQSKVSRYGVIELEYDYTGTPESIESSIGKAIAFHLSKLPPDTTFDIIGHSFGAFAGLYGVMTGGLSQRMHQFISLAGLPFGYNQRLCGQGWCGKAAELIVPMKSPFIQLFEQNYEAEIASMKSCSLYSSADRILKPYDAGHIMGGVNHEVPGMGHLAAATNQRFLNELLRACYDR